MGKQFGFPSREVQVLVLGRLGSSRTMALQHNML